MNVLIRIGITICLLLPSASLVTAQVSKNDSADLLTVQERDADFRKCVHLEQKSTGFREESLPVILICLGIMAVIISGIVFWNKYLRRQVLRKTEKLQKERDFSNLLLQTSPAFFVAISAEGKTLTMNNAMLNALGYTLDEVMDTDYLTTFVPETDHWKLSETFEQLTGSHKPTLNENHVLTKDGRQILAEWHGRPVFKEAGELDFFLGVGIDITERKQAEESLQESERKLSTLMGNLPGMAYRCLNDPDWTMEFISHGARQLTGYAPEDLIRNRTLSYNDLIHPKDQQPVWDQIQEALSQKRHFRLQYRLRTESGEEKWVWEQGVGVFSDKGELLALEGFIIDITERKQAEQSLMWESEFNAAVAALSSKLITDEPIEEISHLVLQYARSLTGSESGFVGYIDPNTGYLVCPTLTRDIWDVCQVDEKDIVFKEFRGLWGWVLNNRKPLLTNAPGDDPRATGVPQDHMPIHRFLSAPALIIDELMGQICLANSDRDYTDRDLSVGERLADLYAIAVQRKRTGEELREYRENLEELVSERTTELEEKARELEDVNIRLQEADRLKSVFLASMSHELRTPLNSIIGFTGIILQGVSGEISEEQRKQLNMVKTSGNHLLDLINDLLDIAKIEAGKVNPSFDKFEIYDVMKEVMEAFFPVVKEKGLELTADMPEGIALKSDRRRILQILMNFVSNAVKFTDRGSVKIRAIVSEDINLQLSVADTGIGIEAEDMDKLFQPFQQVDSSLAKLHEGTGLGLHLTRKLADLLGGSVSATSAFGKGSEFTLRVPITPKVRGPGG